MTLLLNGQAVKVLFGSTSVTCNFGSIAFSARAQLAPPKPPPITTTRAAACAKAGRGNDAAATVAAAPTRQNSRRLMRWLIPMPAIPYFCAASHAAIARDSSSEKPLAMRFITVAGSEPSRKPVIAVVISPASRPYSRDTDEAEAAPAAWQPEQDAAPGGGREAAMTCAIDTTIVAMPRRTGSAFISD